MRLVIVDDHAIVREGIRLMLEGEAGFEVVGEASDGEELFDLLDSVSVDLVLLDLRMERVGGYQVLERIGRLHGGPPVLVLTMHDDPGHLRRAIELGARGYVLKRSGRGELMRALEDVASGRAHVDPLLAPTLVGLVREDGSSPDLDQDALSLLRMLTEGRENREITTATGWTDSQLRTRLAALYGALGVTRRAEAVAVGLRLHLLD